MATYDFPFLFFWFTIVIAISGTLFIGVIQYKKTKDIGKALRKSMLFTTVVIALGGYLWGYHIAVGDGIAQGLGVLYFILAFFVTLVLNLVVLYLMKMKTR